MLNLVNCWLSWKTHNSLIGHNRMLFCTRQGSLNGGGKLWGVGGELCRTYHEVPNKYHTWQFWVLVTSLTSLVCLFLSGYPHCVVSHLSLDRKVIWPCHHGLMVMTSKGGKWHHFQSRTVLFQLLSFQDLFHNQAIETVYIHILIITNSLLTIFKCNAYKLLF